MIKAEFDMQKLESSLKKASKAFGDTTTQAVARWSVQTGRELAAETQAWGKGKAAKDKQWFAIEADARHIIWPVSITGTTKGGNARFVHDGKTMVWPASRVLKSEDEMQDWIEMHRTRRRSRTSKLPFSELAVCDLKIFQKALKARQKKAGMAKGAWLGAANKAATFQRGAQRINIGKNFISYAQKHSRHGTAKLRGGTGFRPLCELQNNLSYSKSPNVVSKTAISNSLGWGLRKTITWYRKAAKQALDQ